MILKGIHPATKNNNNKRLKEHHQYVSNRRDISVAFSEVVDSQDGVLELAL